MADLAELTRNQLLRRADWRFLLPNPQPFKSVCFTKGPLAKAIELISVRTVHGRADALGSCDLAVAVDPDPVTLEAAWESLRAGGSCYTEWHVPTLGGLKAIRRRLEAARFAAVACYWFWPPGPSPRYWVPFDAPGALRYFRSHHPPVKNPLRRFAGGGLRAVWLLGLRVGMTLRVGVTARKPMRSDHPANGHTSIEDRSQVELLERLPSGWSSWGLGATPARLSSLLLTGGPRTVSKVVELIFAEPDSSPLLAVKRPRVPESVPGLAREAAALEAFHASGADGVSGVPRLLFCLNHAGLLTVGETVVTGRPLFTLLRRSNFRDLAWKATVWLAGLAAHPVPPLSILGRDQSIEPVIASFEASFGPVMDVSLMRRAKALLGTLGQLRVVWEHRDFSPWNVLVTPEGELAIVDWESSEPHGLPVLDLFYFLTHLAFFLDGAMASGRFRASYRRMLKPWSFTGRVVDECLRSYLERLGLDADILHPLRVFTWMLHARSEYVRFTADAARRPTSDQLRCSLFVSLFEEELRHAS